MRNVNTKRAAGDIAVEMFALNSNTVMITSRIVCNTY